ncbi:hypothetical protein SADUNF_Sadunf13G0026800 [Salix dunnii]|uniref:Uncharacterized protein n=1 Tax=Salix dunnii TaxID=1413687 RepID=A0A835JF43_9ROSI|nr:hypothetical protein SADUNF_Sadunf13G0026800 [Salix dunnii]
MLPLPDFEKESLVRITSTLRKQQTETIHVQYITRLKMSPSSVLDSYATAINKQAHTAEVVNPRIGSRIDRSDMAARAPAKSRRLPTRVQ